MTTTTTTTTTHRLYVVEPFGDIIERLLLSYVIHQDDTLATVDKECD